MSTDNTDDSQTRLSRRDWLSVTGATVGAAIVGGASTGNVAAQTANDPRINLGDNFYIDDVDGDTLTISDASDGSTIMEYDATVGEWTLPAVNAEYVQNGLTTTSEDAVSHTRYVGPDDPATVSEFDVQDGDVWIEVSE